MHLHGGRFCFGEYMPTITKVITLMFVITVVLALIYLAAFQLAPTYAPETAESLRQNAVHLSLLSVGWLLLIPISWTIEEGQPV